MKRTVGFLITAFSGWLLIVSIFMPPLQNLGDLATNFFNIVAAFAYILGGAALLKMHGSRFFSNHPDRWFSLVALVAFLSMLAAGLFKIGTDANITSVVTDSNMLFQQMYETLFLPIGSTIYALLAFFIASASFRAFQVKNREAAILLFAAVVILLGRTFLGGLLTNWFPDALSQLEIPNLALWLMTGPNLAGQRAILIGTGLGVISIALRILLGVERSHLGRD